MRGFQMTDALYDMLLIIPEAYHLELGDKLLIIHIECRKDEGFHTGSQFGYWLLQYHDLLKQ